MSGEREDDELQGGQSGGEALSVRDSLSAAFDDYEAGQAGGAGEVASGEPAASRTPAAAPAQPPAAKPAQPAAAAGEAVRDQQGRFVAKPGEAAQSPNQSQPAASTAGVGEPGASQTIAPPVSWSATAKSVFPSLPPAIQAEIAKREGDIERGRAQWQQGAERLNRLDSVLAPRSQQFAMRGISDVQAIQALFAAQDYLERDPVDALLYLGRTSGVNWNAFVARLQGQPAQPGQGQGQAALPPGLAPIVGQVEQLTRWAQQQQQQAEQGRMQGHTSAVEQFATDPANVYFHNVRGRMSQLIKAGAAKDLPDAYQQACWADPEIRPLMLQAQASAAETQRQAAARAKVQQARNASGSITGSPAPGAAPGRGAQPKTIRDGLAQAWDDVAG